MYAQQTFEYKPQHCMYHMIQLINVQELEHHESITKHHFFNIMISKSITLVRIDWVLQNTMTRNK